MLIKVFLQTAGNFEEKELLMKFYQGIKSVESQNGKKEFKQYIREGVFLDSNYHHSDCDVAVMIGSWKDRERDHHATRNSIVENSRCFVVIETPLLNRVVFQPSQQHRIGVNGFLNNQGTFCQYNHDQTRLNRLNIDWQGWKNNENGHILLLLQLPGDASLRGVNTYNWALNTAIRIRKLTNRKIVIRTHPSHKPKDTDEWYKFYTDVSINVKDVDFSLGKDKEIKEDLRNAYCSVAYTSGSSIDSIINGIPTLATDPGNFAFEISSNFIEDINNLKLADKTAVKQCLQNLSYSQWSPDEMRSGEAWNHLLPIVNNYLVNMPQEVKKKK
jgi:hypothetical protein